MSAALGLWLRRDPVRLVITVVVVYAMHFAPSVVRETYLAVALGERATIRVDPYVGLNGDVVELPGRGAFINGNPGASFIGAVPYGLVYPALSRVYRAYPSAVSPRPPVTFEAPRPNRARVMNVMRERGMDIRLGLAAVVMQLAVNVVLGAVGALLMYRFLLDRLGRPREAKWFALFFAFGTPMLFRSAFLNPNLLVAYATFFAFLSLTWTRGSGPNAVPPTAAWRPAAAGLCLGLGVFCDYSAVPLVAVFGVWILVVYARRAGVAAAVRGVGAYALGLAGPLAMLAAYQYAAFGNALLPAHAFMSATEPPMTNSCGIGLPKPDLLWRHLFDPRFGVFVFCPFLALALAAPWRASRRALIRRDELWLTLVSAAALYLFCSVTVFARLQWNAGVRDLVPAVPLLYLAALPVLRGAKKWLAWTLVTASVVITWMVSMTRESVPDAFVRFAHHGFELPWMTVLSQTADAYLPALPRSGVPTALYAALAFGLWMLWRRPTVE